MSLSSLTNQLLISALVLTALYFGQHLLVPFVIAVVVWYLLNSLGDLFGKIKIGKNTMPRSFQLVLGLLLFTAVSFMITKLVMSNFEIFADAYPVYYQNFIQLTNQVSKNFDINLLNENYKDSINLPTLIAGALDSSLGFVMNLFLVLLYVIFLLLEQQIFHLKLKHIFHDRSEYVKFLEIARKMDQSIHSYVSIKTMLCLVAGILSYVVLIIIGVDFAFLWAFLIFLFNFIPIIGAFLGVIFPSLIALLQFGSYMEPILVISLLAGIQLVIGNFIEPKVLGTRLNLSPLVVVLALTFWGSIWGIAGMFLCVPIMVILLIILSQFERTKNIAILLSGGKGIEKRS